MGQHCIICNFPCDDEVLFCPECVEADKSNVCDIIRRIGRGEYKKLFFPKENPPVLDDEELENFRKKF